MIGLSSTLSNPGECELNIDAVQDCREAVFNIGKILRVSCDFVNLNRDGQISFLTAVTPEYFSLPLAFKKL
jgi:hypothetical protein